MKLLTRTLLAAVAMSLMLTPMAQAQSRHDGVRHGQHHVHKQQTKPHYRGAPKYRAPAQVTKRNGWTSKTRHQWTKGKRVSNWQRRQHIRDYHRHGLRRPAPGQQWIKVDNDYLLISLLTGIVAGVAIGR